MSLRIHIRAIRALAALALCAGLAAAAHAAQPASIGKLAVLEGTLDVLVEDYADGHSRTRHFVKTDHGRVELKFAARATQLPSGTRVRVHGQAAQGEVLALDGAQVEALTTVLPATMGEQAIAVILVNFADNAVEPITAASANTLVFGNVNNYYQEASFGQTWFTGQVFGYYTIPMSKSVCDNYTLAMQADQAAAAAGVDLTAYTRRVYMFPRNACAWSGLANVGGSGTRAWINGSFVTLTVGHELGHNYGLHHAHALDCDVSALGNTCTSLAYGDAADIMGNNKAGHFNAFEKESLGWLNDGVSPPIHTATSSGRYAIEPYSGSGVGTKAIKIPRGTDASGRPLWYYLEYRQAIGGDTVLGTSGNMTKGVMVRTATEGDGESSYQLDLHPSTTLVSSFTEMADGALNVGETYADAGAKLSFTLVSADASGAVVDVALEGAQAPACVRAAPTLALSGPTTAVAAGSVVAYTVRLTNNDGSGCAATAFNLARNVPTGWTGTLAASALTLSPGASGSTTLQVSSPYTATAGSYGIGVGAGSSVGATHTASAPGTYSVSGPATGTLSESVGTDKTSYLRGETVRMSALVKRDGVALAGASVSFSVSMPSGASAVVSAVSGSDGYARATYRVGKGKSALGSYAVRATASSGGVSASASSAFSVR